MDLSLRQPSVSLDSIRNFFLEPWQIDNPSFAREKATAGLSHKVKNKTTSPAFPRLTVEVARGCPAQEQSYRTSSNRLPLLTGALLLDGLKHAGEVKVRRGHLRSFHGEPRVGQRLPNRLLRVEVRPRRL